MKLLSIPIFLGLLLYVLYAQSIEEETANIYLENKPTEKYIELIEKNEIFTSNHEENVDIKIKKILKDTLKVDIGVDINTTRDKEVILTAYVENLEDNEEEGCNYFWRDGTRFLGLGNSISVSFEKGKHNISVHVQTTDGQSINASKVITAWEYRKEATLYYSEKTGEFIYKRVRTYDYQDNLIQVKGQNSLKTYTYDDKGQEIAMNYENYTDIEYSRSSSYSYDKNGNMVKSENLDAEGNVVWSERGEYNDQNETTSYLMGENEHTLEEVMEEEEESMDELLEEDESTEHDANDKYVYDDNDNLLKSEYSYGTVSVTSKMTYGENNQTLTEKRYTTDGNDSYGTDYKYTYDTEGNVASTEREESENGKVYCHYITTSTYNKDGYVLKESNKILSGDCRGDVYELYVENTYDKEGNIINTKSKTYTKENEKEIKDEISELHRTMKRENYYSNDLDD